MGRGQQQYSTLEIIRNGLWSFSKGFADSLRGAIELFFLDYKRAQQREQKLQQRDIDKELLLNRNSPVREIQNIAKRRALERREKERLRETSGNKQKKAEPTIMERTLKCCVFSILFPLFIVSGNQAIIVSSPGIPALNIFSPTIILSNAIFSKTIQTGSSSKTLAR